MIGAFDAKTHLASLLDRVEAGEEFVITRRGKPVARLVSQHAGEVRKSPEDLVAAVRAARLAVSTSRAEISAWISEGRQ
jgi:prevent-host-death family protein